jgi:inosine-uridine nucleoside N-ribohydrolase
MVLGAAAAAMVFAGCGSGGGDDQGVSTSTHPTAATGPQPASRATMPVIVDTDLAADDIVALSYLAARPDVDILAVTVSGTGEVRCPRGAAIARGLLAAMGRRDVPVACGRSTPISGSRTFPEEWRNAADNVYGLLLEVVAPPAADVSAADLLVDTITTSPTPVVLLTLGPLTNVAEAFAGAPDVTSNVVRVVIMGGAVAVPGNVQPDGAAQPLAAEWNVFVDPAAAASVVESGAPVTLVALDATNHVPMTDDVVERLAANDTSDATARVLRLFDVFLADYLWDPLSAIAAVEPGLVATHPAAITVVTEGDDAGRTVAETDGATIDVADPPDSVAVIDHMLRTLAGVPEGEELATPTTLPVLGEITVGFDGTTCSYGGPPVLPAGAYDVITQAGPEAYLAAVAHLLPGATVDDVLAWATEHPDEDPPMVDDLSVVGGWGEPSPATIVFKPGTVVIACGTEDGAIHVAGSVDVSG